jgi:hypothetical protein
MADLISLEQFRLYAKIRTSDSDELLEDIIIPAVSEAVREYTGFNWDLRTYDPELVNGNNRSGLYARQAGKPGPPIDVAQTMTATENGTALVVSTGYDVEADVIVDPERGLFIRRSGPTQRTTSVSSLASGDRWQPGAQNIALVYTSGYTTTTLPADLRIVCLYKAQMLWRHSDRKLVGISTRSGEKSNVGLLDDLPALYKTILDGRRRWIAPGF